MQFCSREYYDALRSKSILVLTFHKTGTALWKCVLRAEAEAGHAYITEVQPNTLVSTTLLESPSQFFFSEHGLIDIEKSLIANPMRVILSIRDPLRVIVSGYWYHRQKPPSEGWVNTKWRLMPELKPVVHRFHDLRMFDHMSYIDLLRSVNITEGLDIEFLRAHGELQRMCRNYNELLKCSFQRSLIIRFERMQRNYVESIQHIQQQLQYNFSFVTNACAPTLHLSGRHSVTSKLSLEGLTKAEYYLCQHSPYKDQIASLRKFCDYA